IWASRIDRTRTRRRNVFERAIISARYMRAEIAGLKDPIGAEKTLNVQIPGIGKFRTVVVIEARSPDSTIRRSQQNIFSCQCRNESRRRGVDALVKEERQVFGQRDLNVV